ncbi:MAG: LexA repressor [Parcubacteria group bacterium GW2011_GWA1_42_7]|nr:MAG: LexA repressor [Parcubacteria group bacterium GW2011_GWB1_42_6]KKS70132.1 MAG: LexA repressor [Parcubacteria group bacterium GW2011_GWA1_42_7]KKS91813.1 MAG: LexA repressor [Parcubacteria group bacterium GW2011_GWC1_43_12]
MTMDLQKAVLKMRKFYYDRRRLPSYREMARIFGFKSVNAAWRLAQKMISEDFIEKDSSGRLLPKTLNHQLKVLGTVEAGFPTLAEQEEMDTISLDQYLLTRPEKNYMLRVTGLSMKDAGISPNDLVIVEKDKEPKNGDIVIAEVDHYWTMKYFQKRSREVVLLPANKDYPPIYPKSELKIGGVVVSVVKKYY